MSAYSDLILATSGLVGYWRLGEASGLTAADSSVKGHNATYNGTVTYGQSSLAPSGDSAVGLLDPSAYVDIPDHADFSGSGGFSIELWFKIATWDTDGGMVSRRDSGGNGGFTIQAGSGPNIHFYCYVGGWDTVETAWAVDTAFHAVFTFDNDKQRVYQNGSLIATGPARGGAITNGGGLRNRIGRNADGSDHPWNGIYDDVSWYSRALSDAEVAAHYAALPSGGNANNRFRAFQLRPASQ